MSYSPLQARFTLAFLFCAGAAAADPSSQDKAAASQLFDDAEQLAAAGKVADACPKYAESQRLDPHLGTELHLAECYDSLGKTASAWATFKDAGEMADQKNDPRAPKIHARVDELTHKLSRIRIVVTESAPDLEIREDGEVVGKAAWGTSTPVDPGTHTVTARAAGKKAWSATVEATTDGGSIQLYIPTLDAESSPAPVAAAPTNNPTSSTSTQPPVAPAVSSQPPPARPVASPPDATKDQSSVPTGRILGWTAIGVGAVAVGVGVAFEIVRGNKVSERNGICPEASDRCTAEDVQNNDNLTHQARTAATIGAVGLAAGGALALGGLFLVLTTPSPAKAPSDGVALLPVVAPGFQGLSLTGRVW